MAPIPSAHGPTEFAPDACPVILRMASSPQAPASLPTPCPQFRKNLLPLPNHRPELGFWGCRKSFRNWGPGSSKQPGTYEHDTGRNLEGSFRPSAHGTGYENLSKGIFFDKISDVSLAAQGSQGTVRVIGFSAEKNWGVHAGQEFAPTHVWQPFVIYLGRPT